jgi:hypothetical protein
VVVLASVATATALLNRPSWDDTYTQLLAEGTATYRVNPDLPRRELVADLQPVLTGNTPAERLREAHADRPLMVWIWERIYASPTPWAIFAAIHWLSVVLYGLAAGRLWRALMPARPALGVVVAALVVAPITYRLGPILVNPILGGYLGCAVVFTLFAVFAANMSRRDLSLAEGLVTTAGVAAVGTLSEYSVLSTILIAAFLGASAFFAGGEARRRYRNRALLWTAAAVLGYVVLYASGDRTHRRSVDPLSNLQTILTYRWKVTPGRWVEGVWRSVIGGPALAAGEVEVSTKTGLKCAAAAALLTGITLALSRRRPGSHETLDVASDETPGERTIAALSLAVTALGVLAVNLLGRVIELVDVGDTRYAMTYLPFATIAFVYGFFAMLSGKPETVGRAVLIWLAFHAAATSFERLRLENRRLDLLSELVEPHIAPSGLTLVVIAGDDDWIWYDYRDYSLTARITRGWDDPAKKDRVWFILSRWYFGNERAATSLHGVSIAGTDERPWIDRNVRGVGRHEAIAHLLYVELIDKKVVRLFAAEPGGPSRRIGETDWPQ